MGHRVVQPLPGEYVWVVGVEHKEDDPPLPGEGVRVVPEVLQQVGRPFPDEDVRVDTVEEQVVVNNIRRKWWGKG